MIEYISRYERLEAGTIYFSINNDSDFENKHPRDEQGKFCKTESKNLSQSNYKYDKIKTKQRSEIKLPKEEYAQVMHELNTNLTQEQRKKKTLTRYIGNSVYIIENNGFNEYKIKGKYEIDT